MTETCMYVNFPQTNTTRTPENKQNTIMKMKSTKDMAPLVTFVAGSSKVSLLSLHVCWYGTCYNGNPFTL